MGRSWWALALILAGCAHAPAAQPAWSDDSRSDLASQGTTIDARKQPAPPEAPPIATPAPVLVPAAAVAPVAESDAALPPDAPAVRLLDAGAEPRVRLRYRLAGPQTEDMTMKVNMTMATSMGPIPAREMPTPVMRMLASVTSAPAGQGELTSTMQLTEAEAVDAPGLLPGLAEKMGAELRKLKGATTQTRMTTRGAVIKTETSWPPEAPASVRSSLEGLQSSLNRSVVLPAEPVGLGARWETEIQARQNGIDTRQISRFRIRELAGTRVALDIEVEVSAGAQEIALPNANGATAHLESMHGTGSGTTDLDLTSVVPRRSQATLDSQVAMKFQTLDVSTRMKMVMELHAGR